VHPQYAASALGRLGSWAVRRRRSVLAAWVVLLVAAIVGGGALAGEYSADYATPNSESKAAATLLDQGFPDRSEDQVDVVWTARAGAAEPSVAADVDRVLERASSLPGFVSGASTRAAEISPDGRVGVVRLQLDRRADAVPVESGTALRELAEAAPPGVTMAIGAGFVPGVEEEPALSSEVVGLLVAILVLLVTFGTLVAAGLPIASALFGLGISASLIGVLAAVTDVPDWAPQVGAMIGLGVGIDYALLILTRHRAAMSRGLSVHDAAVEAMATAGRSVLVAGGTVAISLAGLFLMGLPYLYGVALAAMLAVAVVLAASLTLLPAILGVMGRGVDRLRLPGVRAADPDGGGARAAAWARAVQRRPLVAAVATTAILLALTAPVTGLRLGFPDAGNDAEGTTTRQAYDLLAQGFGAGANGPLMVVAATPDAADRAQVDALARDLARQPGVAAVSPVQANETGTTAVLAVTPASSPQAERTEDLVHELRDGPLADSGLREVHLGGSTAATVDQGEATAARLPLFIGGVVVLSFLLLLVAFRAPVVALKAGAMNLLSIGAAYGVVTVLAQGGWAGQLVGIDTDTPVAPFIPVMMFAVLFGLSMDYEVFLLSRIREERARLGSTTEAVVEGLARTARVITAAALIMVAVFSAFALSPEVFIKLIGLGLATAILVDATLVRMVLVPAVMQLLGERNWWLPGWLDRLLPEARLEGPELVPHAERDREAVAA
jgi:RND superfamily putative drug exporter